MIGKLRIEVRHSLRDFVFKDGFTLDLDVRKFVSDIGAGTPSANFRMRIVRSVDLIVGCRPYFIVARFDSLSAPIASDW